MCGGRIQHSLFFSKQVVSNCRQKSIQLNSASSTTLSRHLSLNCSSPCCYRQHAHELYRKTTSPTPTVVCLLGFLHGRGHGLANGNRLLGFGLGDHARLFSSGQTSSTGLTDDILKKQIGELPHESTKNDAAKTDSAKTKSDDKKKKDDSWFSNKNAWKLGVISLSAMSVIVVGQLVFLWGTLFTRIIISFGKKDQRHLLFCHR